MNSKNSSVRYKKEMMDKWANIVGIDDLYTWLIPNIQRFAQGEPVGMRNGANLQEGELSTSEMVAYGFKYLRFFQEALQDFDWLQQGFMEKVPI